MAKNQASLPFAGYSRKPAASAPLAGASTEKFLIGVTREPGIGAVTHLMDSERDGIMHPSAQSKFEILISNNKPFNTALKSLAYSAPLLFT
jgi:hypothetical protein